MISKISSVQTMRGADYWTDHHLIRATLALKIHLEAKHTFLPHPKQLDVSKLHSLETKTIFVNAINSIELNEANTWEDFKVRVLFVARNTLGVHKRKCQDWFSKNCEEINALLEMKCHLFYNTLPPNLYCYAKERDIKKHKELQSVVQNCMCKIKN